MRTVLIGVVALGASLLAAPASASGYDPSGLCASATPTLAQVNAAAATIRKNTGAAVRKAGGARVHQTGKAASWTSDGTLTVDVRDRRSRQDSVLLASENFIDHTLVDGAAGYSYDGHFASDATYQPYVGDALRILRRKRVWVKHKLTRKERTRQAIVDEVAGGTQLTELEPYQGEDPPTYTYSCAVSDGVLTVAETSTEDSTDIETISVAFTRTGAIAWTTSDSAGGSTKRDDLSYGRHTVRAPKHSNIISFRRWSAAVRKVTG